MTCDVVVNGRRRRVDVRRAASGLIVSVDGQQHAADVNVSNGIWSLILGPVAFDGAGAAGGGLSPPAIRRSYEVAVVERPGSEALLVYVNGRVVSAAIDGGRTGWARRGASAAAPSTGTQRLVAPMPGKIVKVLVTPGDQVSARQGVIVVEAMKMENELRSSRAGRVAEVRVAEGALVEAGAVLVVID